ncbi:MAG: hypothetical protein ACK53A_03775 [Gemmatimonadota bacterium]|jgi:hypothetical protein
MPLVPFDALPADARAWVFAASRPLDDADAATLLAPVDAYLATWKAHGAPLTVGRELREGRFLVVGIDQRTAGASGCSIDALYRTLQGLEATLGTSLVSGGRVFWRSDDGTVHGGTRAEFAAAASRGEVGPETQVFDTTVGSVGALATGFERRAADSWHGQLLASPR